MSWHALAPAKVFAPRRGRIYTVAGHKLAVFLVDGRYYAIDNFCPHAGASLGLGSVKGRVVTCPRHKWLFNVETGACVTHDAFDIDTFPTRVRAGQVEVQIEDA